MSRNSVLKLFTVLTVSAAIISSAAATANAASVEELPVRAAIASEHTDVYDSYLNGKVEIAPGSGVNPAPYSVSASLLQPSSALPASFKSRTTDIRDQGAYNTCWAFSAMGALETYLAVDGKGLHDLSEQHLVWWPTSQYNTDGFGWQMDGLDAGGYSMMGVGYLASWQGAKTENDLPYKTGGNRLPDNMDTAENAYNVTGIVYVDNDITSVKTAVYEYGAVATSFNGGSGYNSDLSAYYQSKSTNVFSGHAITIVGWDDNYSKENFSASDRPGSDGAWLVKNSWGNDVGDNGYLWISYYDRYILDTNTWGANYAITEARTNTGYDKLYQNEEYGSTYLIGVADDEGLFSDNVTYVNCFDFDSEHNILEKVIFESESQNANYTVYYIPVKNNEPVADESLWTKLASGVVNELGYVSVDTDCYSISAGKGAIGVRIDTSKTAEGAYMGVDEWLTDASGTMVFKPDQHRNESFVIIDGEAYDVVDLYAEADDDIGGTLVIKALTTTNVIGDVNLDGAITSLDSFMAQRMATELEIPNEDQRINADVNYDGEITALDSFIIRRKSVGLVHAF